MEEGQIDPTGQILGGRYRITGLLGQGAMAYVYRGVDLQQEVEVAIKVLHDDVKDRSSFQDRFEREVLITSKVNHPCCIHKLDFGLQENGLPYQVMELVPGGSLADVLDACEALPIHRALHIFAQLLQALAVCGDAGIIHRDVKPENILIYSDHRGMECLKLIDFGIAKLVGAAAEGHEKLTSIGLILGTPHYIAPEWVTSDNVDPRADLYSATILLFEMLTSAPPFLSEDRRDLMKQHLREVAPSLQERAPQTAFPEALEAMVRKGLAKDPNDRYADAHEYLRTLHEIAGAFVPGWNSLPQVAAAPIPQRAAILTPIMDSAAIVHLPQTPRRRSPLGLLLAGGVLVAILVAIAMLDGDSANTGKVLEDAGFAQIETPTKVARAVEASDAAPTPLRVVPLSDAQIAPALAVWRDAQLEVTGFSEVLDDDIANGACRFGKVEAIDVLLCATLFDPVKGSKAMRRSLPGKARAGKWRGRIRRKDIQVRVDSVKKKKRKLRRKIEAAFKSLPK